MEEVITIDIYQKVQNKYRIIKIGVGFSSQKIKNIPINKHDKKLDCIITGKKLLNENLILR